MATATELPQRAARDQRMTLYKVDLGFTHPGFPFSTEFFTRRSDAEQFVEDVRCDNPSVAAKLRIEEQEL